MIRIHGDSHGNLARFPSRPIERHCADRTLIKNMDCAEHNIHVGDVGFDYTPLNGVSNERLKIILGNHDNYDNPPKQSLGDFGVNSIGELDFFFIRGAYSIDKQYRDWNGPDKSWWQQEELDENQMCECLDLYGSIKPDLVISHDCPYTLCRNGLIGSSQKVLNPSRTARFLEIAFSIHQPKVWIFGHWHKNLRMKIQDTEFICISELCYVDWTKDEGFKGPF